MKNLLLYLILFIVTMTACSKNSQKPEARVRFTQDQQDFEIHGDWDHGDKTIGSLFARDSGNNESGDVFVGLYQLGFQDSAKTMWSIKTSIINKPEVKTYYTNFDNTWRIGFHSSSVFQGRYPGIVRNFQINSADDFTELTITRIHNRMVDGTFSARLTDITQPDKKQINITNGVFTNCRWLY